MGHTRPVSETIIARAKREPEFRAALVGQAIECIVENDVQTAKRLIRDYVLASTGFEALGKKINKKPEASCVCSARRAIPP
jgi:hypothetical protein